MNTHTMARHGVVLAAALVTAVSLTGCRTVRPIGGFPGAGGTPTQPASVRDVDLRNATYPTAACPERFRMAGDTFTLRDGFAGALPNGPLGPGLSDVGVEFKDAVYGDVNGDGRDDVAVRFMCGVAFSGALSDGIAVMEVRHGRFTPLASISRSGVPATGVEAVTNPDGTVSYVPFTLEYELVEAMVIEGCTLRVHWVQDTLRDDVLADGYDVRVTYRVEGGQALIVSSDRQPRLMT
jgi:hypothetical protein